MEPIEVPDLKGGRGVRIAAGCAHVWNGVTVRAVTLRCDSGKVLHDISHPQDALNIELEQVGGRVEWKHKDAGFVSHGGVEGARAVDQLRLVLAEVHVATVRAQVLLSLRYDFENFTTFRSESHQEKQVGTVLDEVVVAWSGAVERLR
jgi:hypothetical protein